MTSWLHGVGAPRFERVDGQKAERAFWVAIAKEGVWNIGSILQGLAGSIPSRIVTAISRLGYAFDDEDHSANGVSVKRSCATGWVGHLNDGKFPMIARQWKTFENLACDTHKPGLLGACPTVGIFTHCRPFLVERRAVVGRSDRGANDYGDAASKQQGAGARARHVGFQLPSTSK
jgi:hypothetical protein